MIVTSTERTGFVMALLETRRDRGLTVADASRVTGLPEEVIRSAEAGEEVAPAHVMTACGTLAIDPVAHVRGLPEGPVEVPPAADPVHARAMAGMADEAAGRGWLLHPDVVAWDASLPHVETHDEACARLRRAARRTARTAFLSGSGVSATCLLAGLVVPSPGCMLSLRPRRRVRS